MRLVDYDEIDVTAIGDRGTRVIRVPRISPRVGALSGFAWGTGDGTAVTFKAVR